MKIKLNWLVMHNFEGLVGRVSKVGARLDREDAHSELIYPDSGISLSVLIRMDDFLFFLCLVAIYAS